MRHHLIDVAGLEEGFDAAQFAGWPGRRRRRSRRAGGTPIFCGGTGLYFKAYLRRIGEAPAADAAIRAELEASRWRNYWRNWNGAIRPHFEPNGPAESAPRDSRGGGDPADGQAVFASNGRHGNAGGRRGRDAYRLDTAGGGIARAYWRAGGGDVSPGLVAETGIAAGTRAGTDNPTAMQALGYRQVVEHLRGQRGAGRKRRSW